MLRLQTEPEWLGALPGTAEDPRPYLVPGVRVRFAPIGPKAFRAAGQAMVKVLTSAGEGAEPDNEEASDAIARELIVRGIVAWEGVGPAGRDDDEPLPVTDAAKAAFAADAALFLAAEAAYVTPYLLRDAEGKGSSGSPNGTGERVMPAPDTAPSPAVPSGTDGATTTIPASPPAPISSMSPTPKRRKRSGR